MGYTGSGVKMTLRSRATSKTSWKRKLDSSAAQPGVCGTLVVKRSHVPSCGPDLMPQLMPQV
jgi:hypothetical protein